MGKKVLQAILSIPIAAVITFIIAVILIIISNAIDKNIIANLKLTIRSDETTLNSFRFGVIALYFVSYVLALWFFWGRKTGTKTSTLSKGNEHGKFLTVLIIWCVISALSNIPQALNPANIQKDFGSVPSWYTPLMLTSIGLQVVGLIGVWMWKKWGIYTYFATFVLGLTGAFLLLKGLSYAQLPFMIALVVAFATVGLWIWALYRKWPNFS